jgi:hypothetical protein
MTLSTSNAPSLEVTDPFAYFYILAKVHKTPWKSRPIVSVSGSITHGLGRWLDQQLQPICKRLPSYLKSSVELKQKLSSLTFEPNAHFFTADATSMYTNIDTDHAIAMIAGFLRTSPLCAMVSNKELILHALELIMRRNYFKFGDTYWLQLTGTAMGTPPAPMYATLYFGIWEMEVLPLFSAHIPFYCRYIDDCFGIWNCDEDPDTDYSIKTHFKLP